MEFLGREAELAAFARRLERATDGEGSIVLVYGEPGIGKSRFMRRVAELAADRGATTASGRWYEAAHVPAYVGFLESFRQLLNVDPKRLGHLLDLNDPHVRELARLGPEIATALGLVNEAQIADDPDPYGLWCGVDLLLEAVCGTSAPVVLTLDDTQWADPGSLELLAFIRRNIANLPLVILVGYRGNAYDSELPVAPPGGDLEEIGLTGFHWEEVRTLAEGVVGSPVDEPVARSICDYTSGNPLFVEEMSRRLASALDPAHGLAPGRLEELLRKDLPKSIRTFMTERLFSLSAETQYLLQLAACFGRNFDLLLIKEIADLEEPALSAILEEGLETGVINETDPGQFAFTHPLMREVSYAAIAPANRIAIHERVALALEVHYGETAARHAREIANHLISAGGLADPSKTLRYCTMGARQARVLFASEEMHRLAGAAIGALERMPIQAPRLMASLLLEKAYAHTVLGHPDEAISAYRKALRIYNELDDAEGAVDCNRWLATTLARYGRWEEASALTTEALAAAEEVRSHAYLALAGVHAFAAMASGRFEEAGVWSDKLLELSFDEETKAVAHHVAAAHNSYGVGDPKIALHHFEASRAYFLSTVRDGTAAQVAADQAVALYLLGHVEESIKAYDFGRDLAERTNRITAMAELCAYEVVLETHRGNWPAVREAADRWQAMTSGMGGSTIYGQLVEHALALQRQWRDGPAIDMDALRAPIPLRSEPLQAYLFAEQGQTERAAELVKSIKGLVPIDGRGFFWLSGALPLAATQIALRDKAVEEWLPGLQRYTGCAFDWFHVDIEVGRIYALLENWERAEESFQKATAQCDADGLRSFSGIAHYHYGVMLLERRERNHRKQGLAEVEYARDVFSEIGMDYLAAKAQQALPKALSGRAPGRNPGNLTTREWEILSQLAKGRTNVEISDVLVISRRTVEYHLQNIYGKIAVKSRAAAIAWLAKQSTLETTAS